MTSARDLTNRLADLLRRERAALADFLVAVADFDRRRLWLVVTAVRPPAPALALASAAGPGPDLSQLAVHPANQLAPLSNAPVTEPVPAGVPPSAPRTAPVVEPLTADESRYHLTVSRAFLRKLEAARAALSHSHPGASADEILEAGLDLLLERHAKRKGLVKKPRKVAPAAKPEHVPAHVRRAVWERDGGRCQYPLESGGVCGSTHQVELDHVVPRARGGPSTIENTRILCRVHNDLAARQVYGNDWMDSFTRGKRGPVPGGRSHVSWAP
jgi:hypothetical protein